MVYLTGDTHSDFKRFFEDSFPDQKNMTKEDIVIILGDFGLWNDGGDKYRLEWLNRRPWTTVWIDGNHECFDRLYSDEFPIVDFHGGKAHKIRDNIYHLMRGYIFDFEGKKFFAFGGASSHDVQDGILDRSDFKSDEDLHDAWADMVVQGKIFRVNHISWWKQEIPSKAEMECGKQNLEAVNYKVDYVITHCLPYTIASSNTERLGIGRCKSDVLMEYFDDLLNRGLQFKKWYCGHYHKNTVCSQQYEVFYKSIARII